MHSVFDRCRGTISVRHGACDRRRNAAISFGKCRGPAALPDTFPSQTRICSAGRRGGHHRGQLWPGERLAPCLLNAASLKIFNSYKSVPLICCSLFHMIEIKYATSKSSCVKTSFRMFTCMCKLRFYSYSLV